MARYERITRYGSYWHKHFEFKVRRFGHVYRYGISAEYYNEYPYSSGVYQSVKSYRLGRKPWKAEIYIKWNAKDGGYDNKRFTIRFRTKQRLLKYIDDLKTGRRKLYV